MELKKEVDGDINLSPKQTDDQNGGTIRNSYLVIYSDGDNNMEFEDAQERSTSATVFPHPAEALLLFNVLLPSVNHLFVMALIFYHKQSSQKRYLSRSNQPLYQTTLTSGSPESTENMNI